MESFPRAAPPASFIVHAAPRLAPLPSSASARRGSANPNQGKRGQAKQVLGLRCYCLLHKKLFGDSTPFPAERISPTDMKLMNIPIPSGWSITA